MAWASGKRLRPPALGDRSKKGHSDRDLIQKSLKQFNITADMESEQRSTGLDDLKFSVGLSQWDQGIKNVRELEGKPCLTVNRIPTFLRQYTGEEREQRPAMLVDPVGSGADVEVARIYQGVLRHIEVASMADTTYDSAYDMMLRIGWSYWRINHEYLSERSFDQEPRIAPIDNPFSVYMSPIRRADGTDPLWCHCIQDMSKEEYEEAYPQSKLASIELWSSVGNHAPGWVTRDGVRVAEYWYMELEKRTLLQLADGNTVFKDDLPADFDEFEDEREVVTRTVNCVKHNAVEILERYDWTGKYIPILEVNGTRLNIDGKIYKAGMVRDAKDPQRLYNYEITGAAEMVALAPKDPVYVAEGSLGNHEEEYRVANRKNFAFLYYKAYDDSGRQLPPPTRASREPPIQAMQALVQQADYDLKSVIGIYESTLGQQGSPQESGLAILNRKEQAGIGSVNYSGNLNNTIRWQGKILLDDFPHLITAARVQRIINPDDSVKHAVVFNSQHSVISDAQALATTPELAKIYDLGTGNYDVTLSTGPTYRTARKEAFAAMTAIVSANPELFQVLGDIWAKNADWPDADLLADRLKKLLPPNLQDQDQSDPQTQIAALQSQLQQLGLQHNQMVAELARATDTIRTKRIETESKERIANMQGQVTLTQTMLQAHADGAQAKLEAELASIGERLTMLHQAMTPEQDAGEPVQTPELPNAVEPKVQPITPAAPTTPVQPI